MIIAVDFDGTIVEHAYPEIGRIRPFAFETLLALQGKKHQLILWTHRSGPLLQRAVEFCRQNGVEFYAINSSYPEESFTSSESRKILADIYIDDRNVGGLPSWGEIYRLICPDQGQGPEARKTGKWWHYSRRNTPGKVQPG